MDDNTPCHSDVRHDEEVYHPQQSEGWFITRSEAK